MGALLDAYVPAPDAVERHEVLVRAASAAVVFGLTGRFWTRGGDVVPTDPATWHAGPPPGTAQAAWSFEVRPHGTAHTRLVTETRVRCADAATRRAFRRYWRVVRPGSGLLRRILLGRIRRLAERRPGAAAG